MPSIRCTRLPAIAILAATGRDARSFLQGQLSNDILGLERHPGMLAASCNRQGRVLATMRLAAAGESVLMLLQRPLAQTLVAQMSAFVLRADVRFEDRSRELEAVGLIDAEPDARWSQASAAASGLAMLVASPRRILLAGSRESLDAALHAVPRSDPADWDRACIEDGEAWITPSTNALWLPQMLNLDLVGGVSFSKGCYTGQEIIARTQHRGRIKRRMLRYGLRASPGLEPGDSVQIDGHAGRVVEVAARNATEHEFLAVMTLEGSARPDAPDLPAVRLPLPYSIPDVDA